MSKNDKTALVPKLRFPEFARDAEWKKYKLSEIADRVTEKVAERRLITLSISAGTGFVSQAEKFSRDISGKQYENYILLKKGEFSYNKGNSKTFPQGCIYELKEYDEAAVPNVFISFRFDTNYISGFYKGYFESNFHGKQLMRFITSGARMDGLLNINPTDFLSIVLPTPVKKEEQQKIADCLSSLDELIAAEDKKLEELKSHKKGLMQKLFPAEGKTVPEWRFPEFRNDREWKIKKITQIARTSIGLVTTMTKYYVENGVKLIRNSDIKENRINEDNLINLDVHFSEENKSRKFQKFDIVTVHTGDIGISAVIDGDMIGSIGFATLNTRPNVNVVSPHFLCWYYNSPQNIRYATKMSTGDGRNNYNLRDFDNAMIPFPTLPEQQKIADCLSSIDQLITEKSKKIQKLKEHKKGLMQGLFPSFVEVCK